MLRFSNVLLIILICSYFSISGTNDSIKTSHIEPTQINLNTYVEKSKIPLNRSVVLRIELSWKGELSRYQIEPVTQPILTNLLLEGSGSENRLETQEDGSFRAVKSITYRFHPLEMGMAYIDGMTIKYIDKNTGVEEKLSSQRIMVEVEEPLPEPDKSKFQSTFYLILLIIFFTITGYFIFLYFRKRRDSRISDVPVISLPESYLNILAQEVDPKGTNLDEMITRLTRIFKEYLDKDFGLHTKEKSTKEIVEQLQNLDIDEMDKNNLQNVFEKLDVIKFTGNVIDPNDFSNIYGTIETFLIKRKQQMDKLEIEKKEEE
jgi:hypothetical protein